MPDIQPPPTLLDLLQMARRTEAGGLSITSDEIEAAYDRQRVPHRRKTPFFVRHKAASLAGRQSNRTEERLAKHLCADQRELSLGDGTSMRFIDFQFPLKAVR